MPWGASVSPPPPPTPRSPSPAQPSPAVDLFSTLCFYVSVSSTFIWMKVFGPPAHFAHQGLFPFWRLSCLTPRSVLDRKAPFAICLCFPSIYGHVCLRNTHTHTHTHGCVFPPVYVRVCLWVYICAYIHLYTHTRTHINIYIDTCVYMHICTCTMTYMYVHVYTWA